MLWLCLNVGNWTLVTWVKCQSADHCTIQTLLSEDNYVYYIIKAPISPILHYLGLRWSILAIKAYLLLEDLRVDCLSSQLLVIFHLKAIFKFKMNTYKKECCLFEWKSSFEWKNYDIFFQNSQLKVSEFQNEFMKSSFLPKYVPNITRISALHCATLQFLVHILGETIIS